MCCIVLFLIHKNYCLPRLTTGLYEKAVKRLRSKGASTGGHRKAESCTKFFQAHVKRKELHRMIISSLHILAISDSDKYRDTTYHQ